MNTYLVNSLNLNRINLGQRATLRGAGYEKRGPCPSSDKDGRIYCIAITVLKKKNLKFGHFTSQSRRDGREMYKKA